MTAQAEAQIAALVREVATWNGNDSEELLAAGSTADSDRVKAFTKKQLGFQLLLCKVPAVL